MPDEQRDTGSIQMNRDGIAYGWVEAADRRSSRNNWCQVRKVQALRVNRRGSLIGREAAGSTSVVEDCSREKVVGRATEALAAVGNIEPVVADRLAGIDGHIIALANANEEAADGLGVDRHQIGGDDRHRVAHERKLKMVLHRGVDDAETMALAGRKGHIGVLTGPGDRVHIGTVE